MEHKLIIALGNPGEKFIHTRHNLGQDSISSWIDEARDQGADVRQMQSKESWHARVQDIIFQGVNITILFPDVFMNESGKAVMQYLRFNEIERKNIVVVHDDLELSLGEIKFQETGSAHGHNGMRSVQDFLGTIDIPQLRIGIGRPVDDRPIEKFVLEKFSPEEQAILKEKQKNILRAVSEVIFS